MVGLAVLATKRIVPLALSPVTSRTSAVSPTLMPASLRSATSTTASMGSSATSVAISRPAKENAAWPTSTATSCTTPDQGARTMPRSRSASAAASAASPALSWASRSTSCSRGSVPLKISARLASSSVRFCVTTACACATCASRASSKDGDDLALLDPAPALDPQLGEDAAGACRQRHPFIGLCSPGNGELAAVRHDDRADRRDAEQLLRPILAGAHGGTAFRRLVRQKVPGRDPKPGSGYQADRGEAARFHFEFSLMTDTLAAWAARDWPRSM